MKISLIQKIIDNIRMKTYINFIVFWVGTKCTLRCEKCCNLIPYVDQVSYNADEILKDLAFLVKNTKIKNLQIQGGEPFTHPEIVKIINTVSKLKIKNIDLATNGTVKLNQNVLDALKANPNINVRISNYDCTSKLRENFIKQLEENNINYRMYEFLYGNNMWFSTGGIDEKATDDTETAKTYDLCEDKDCQTLADGTLYVCGKVPSIKEIYNYNARKKYDDINIRKIRKSSFPLKNYFLKFIIKNFYKNLSIYKEPCRFCKILSEKFPAAKQLSNEEFTAAKTIIQDRKTNSTANISN